MTRHSRVSFVPVATTQQLFIFLQGSVRVILRRSYLGFLIPLSFVELHQFLLNFSGCFLNKLILLFAFGAADFLLLLQFMADVSSEIFLDCLIADLVPPAAFEQILEFILVDEHVELER